MRAANALDHAQHCPGLLATTLQFAHHARGVLDPGRHLFNTEHRIDGGCDLLRLLFLVVVYVV